MRLWMKRLITDNRIFQMILVTVAAVCCLTVWPFRVFYHETVSSNKADEPLYTGAVTMEEIALQQFSPAQDYLAGITIQCTVEDVHPEDRVFVTVYDSEYGIIYQEVPHFQEIEAKGEIVITPELSVIPGEIYYVGLNVHFISEGTLRVAYADTERYGLGECGVFAYASVPYENMQMQIAFRYTKPYSTRLILYCMLGIVLGAAAVYMVCALFKALLQAKGVWEPVKRVLLFGCFLLVEAAVLGCAWFLCIEQIFGGETMDIAVYAFAALTVFLLAAYACYRTVFTKVSADTGGKTPFLWRDYVQVVSVAVLLWAGIRYVNADVQWKQDLARNWLYLLFGLFVVFTLRFRLLVSGIAVAWAILCVPAGMLYCRQYGTDEHSAQLACTLMVTVFLWGIVLIWLLCSIKRQKNQKFCIPLVLCWAAMCILMLINRHGKSWPIFASVVFTLFILVPYTREQRERIMHNFMLGIVVNFFWVWGESLWHRPFHNQVLFRYPMFFYTVGCTGMYLILVEGVALLRLFLKIKRTGKLWKHAWKEWLLNAVVVSYIALTVSRTAFVALFGMCAALMIAGAIVYRPRIKKYVLILALSALCVLIAIPTVYTVTRCVPAIVNQPVRINDFENFAGAIRQGEAPDSPRYQNVRSQMHFWCERLGLPDAIRRLFLNTAQAERREQAAAACTGAVQTEFVQIGTVASIRDVSWDAAASVRDVSWDAAASVRGISWDVLAQAAAVQTMQNTSSLDDMTNGRLDIFIKYFRRLNFSGHKEMGIIKNDGGDSGHAHNSFLQNAYDFGIPAGLLFLGLIFGMIGRSVFLIWTGRDRSEMQFMTFIVLTAFVLVSLTEYSSNPCTALGFALHFVLFTMRREKSMV